MLGFTQINEGAVMIVTIAIVVVFSISIILCHIIAKKRGGNPVLWGVMGTVFGPFAIPFVIMFNPKDEI